MDYGVQLGTRAGEAEEGGDAGARLGPAVGIVPSTHGEGRGCPIGVGLDLGCPEEVGVGVGVGDDEGEAAGDGCAAASRDQSVPSQAQSALV